MKLEWKAQRIYGDCVDTEYSLEDRENSMGTTFIDYLGGDGSYIFTFKELQTLCENFKKLYPQREFKKEN